MLAIAHPIKSVCLQNGTWQAHRGKRKGQSMSADPAKNGCTIDVGLLEGGRAALHSASRADDGIPRSGARAGELANACLGRGRVTDCPIPLLFPGFSRWRHR